MGSVWSPHYANIEKKEKDIREINQLNKYKNGNCLMFKTISYLSDRARSLYYWDLLDLKFRYKSWGLSRDGWRVYLSWRSRSSCCGATLTPCPPWPSPPGWPPWSTRTTSPSTWWPTQVSWSQSRPGTTGATFKVTSSPWNSRSAGLSSSSTL